MHRYLSFLGAALLALAFVTFGSADAQSAEKEDSKPARSGNVSVKIQVDELHPTVVHVQPGTTIIWVNKAQEPVRVRFLSHAVSTTCKAPRGFVVGTKGIYESEEIAEGDVASLCFLEKESYDYTVDVLQSQPSGERLAKSFKGTVVVRK